MRHILSKLADDILYDRCIFVGGPLTILWMLEFVYMYAYFLATIFDPDLPCISIHIHDVCSSCPIPAI